MGNPGIENGMRKDTEAWNNAESPRNYKPFDIAGTQDVRGGVQRWFVGEATDIHVPKMCIFICGWLWFFQKKMEELLCLKKKDLISVELIVYQNKT